MSMNVPTHGSTPEVWPLVGKRKVARPLRPQHPPTFRTFAQMSDDERFATNPGRLAHRGTLTDTLDAIFGEHPVAHWLALLQGHVPVAPVHDIARAMDNPWLDTIGMIDTVSHPDRANLRVLASPIKVDGQRVPSRAGPLLGADADDVLGELGYDADAIATLRQQGVI